MSSDLQLPGTTIQCSRRKAVKPTNISEQIELPSVIGLSEDITSTGFHVASTVPSIFFVCAEVGPAPETPRILRLYKNMFIGGP